MRKSTRRVVSVGAAAACALASIGIGQALAATDPGAPPTYARTDVDTALTGAAFVVAGNVAGDVRPELVASAFGAFIFGGGPPIPPAAGTVTLYRNTSKNKQGGEINAWAKTTVVSEADAITFPNQPALADVDLDGDVDVIVPGGYFFDSFLPGPARGSLTWWENRANGRTWVRHDLIGGSSFSYHSVQVADLDGDGIKDLVTVGEDGGNPGNGNDDIVELQYLKGLGGGNFAPPVKLGNGGGSLPVVSDVNGDGQLDVVSAQFFGNVAGQPFVPSDARGPAESSFVWFQQGDDGLPGLSPDDFTAHKISAAEGPAFQIIPVPNLLGDGVTRWIGTNHTNKSQVPPLTSPPFSLYPEPAVYQLTPAGDPEQAWESVKLTGPNAFLVCGGAGQAAPGGVGAGDLDGDGDIDLAVSGDGSRFVYWVEQKGDATFAVNTMPGTDPPSLAPSCQGGFGQAGGSLVVDLNRDGINEAVWGSFDQNAVAIWQR